MFWLSALRRLGGGYVEHFLAFSFGTLFFVGMIIGWLLAVNEEKDLIKSSYSLSTSRDTFVDIGRKLLYALILWLNGVLKRMASTMYARG